jgi:hypothetical protein
MAVIDSTAVDARGRGPRRRLVRLLGVLIAVVGVVGVVGLTAGPAAAAQTCTGRSDSNLCLAVDALGGGLFRVHVGIDVHMSFAQAQEYIDDPGDPFVVTIVGDDGIVSCPIFCGTVIPVLFQVPLTALGASDESGLSADFDVTVPGSALNEDPPGQEDEIRTFVELWDRDTNRLITRFMSNQLSGNWS